MTISELREFIKELPSDMPVVIKQDIDWGGYYDAKTSVTMLDWDEGEISANGNAFFVCYTAESPNDET